MKIKKALIEVDEQIKKAKFKIGCNIFNLTVGVILSLTIILLIFGIPLIIFSIIGIMLNQKKVDTLKIKKAELEGKK